VPWAQDSEADEFHIAIIGGLPDLPGGLVDSVLQRHPDILMFTSIGKNTDLEPWGINDAMPVLAVSDRPATRAWLKRFDGVGVEALPRAVPYGSVDLVTEGIRWRVVYATARTEPQKRWEEQSYWLPKVLDRGAYDRLLILTDAPPNSLGASAQPERGADALLRQAQESADPLSFVAMISGNTGTNEVLTPGGRFGELQLVAGSAGGGVDVFRQSAGGGLVRHRELEPAFASALEAVTHGQGVYRDVQGYWMLELSGGEATLDFWMRGEGGYEVVYRFVRTQQGWGLP